MSKPIYKNYIKIGIILGFVAYTIMFVYTFFIQDINTLALKNGIVEEVSIADGIITRTEEVITLDVKDALNPLVSSGQRVSKGQALATIETQNIISIEEKIETLNKEIGNVVAPSSFDSELKSLDAEIVISLNKVIKLDAYNSLNTIQNLKEELNQSLQKRIYKISEMDKTNKEVKEYVSKMNEYRAELKKMQTTVKSIMAGTVLYKLDGYEKILTTEKISSYTPEILDTLNIPKGELVGTSKENSFKIVDNLECYITVVLDKKETEDAYVDQKVTLRFPEIDNALEVSGVIDYMNFTQNGSVITFKINRAIEDIMNYRKTKVEIVWDSEEGYKVPTNTIVKEGEQNKIYIYLGRNYVVEKYINIIKEYDGYAIIEGIEGNKLYMYDSVILDASNINLNKMLKY
ncbi:MAG: hypothetical protein E7314_04895 [Clostridiales bacterium]|nr:hypothetical protein [Clostridiales bacterium]